MAAEGYKLEVFALHRETNRVAGALVPFTQTPPVRNWHQEDGEVLWTLNGATFINRDAPFYPLDQLAAITALLGFAMRGKAHSLPLPGSIVTIGCEPVDVHRAKFTLDIPARRVNSRIHNEAEHRECNANVRKAAESVREAVLAMISHIDANTLDSAGGAPATHGYGHDRLATLAAALEIRPRG